MSFNPNDMINPGNYEEYFILYTDNELDAAQKLMVENFVAQHPHLAAELDLLLSTRLTADDLPFEGKDDLLAAAMKTNLVDETLLLYVDGELPAAESKAVAQKIAADRDYALQHSLLVKTKLDPNEIILHPNKKELYRHTEKVVSLRVWLRVAAAAVVLLAASLLFLNRGGDQLPGVEPATTASTSRPATTKPEPKTALPSSGQQMNETATAVPNETSVAQVSVQKLPQKKNAAAVAPVSPVPAPKEDGPQNSEDVAYTPAPREAIRFDASRFTDVTSEDAFKKPLTAQAVTIDLPETYNPSEAPQETAGSDGDFKNTKKTSAKGFFRKVSRFIERNTGIGTANADNELLIGAVAVKLK